MNSIVQKAIFAELVNQIRHEESRVVDDLATSSGAHNWLGKSAADMLSNANIIDESRRAIVYMCRVHMMNICSGIMAAFDGETAMSDHGRPAMICDRNGVDIGGSLSQGFMDYLTSIEWQ